MAAPDSFMKVRLFISSKHLQFALLLPRGHVHDLAGIHTIVRIQGFLDRAHDLKSIAVLLAHKVHFTTPIPCSPVHVPPIWSAR
jgi:hypothetical protein